MDMFSDKQSSNETGDCPICNGDVGIDPSLWFGETTCPNCGETLWAVRFTHGLIAFKPSEKVRERTLEEVLSEYLGIEQAKLDPRVELDLGIDSLDFVELVIELEEEMV